MIKKSEIGRKFLALRKSLGLTQEAFGKPLKAHRVTISQIEKGVIYPSLEHVIATVLTYKIPFESLLLEEDQIEITPESEKERILDLKETIEALKTSNRDKEKLIRYYETNFTDKT